MTINQNNHSRSVLSNHQNTQPPPPQNRLPLPQKPTPLQHQLANTASSSSSNTTVPMNTESVESDLDTSQANLVEDFRRNAQEAFKGLQYSAAMFWADKVVSLTGDPGDIRQLAQACYSGEQFMRAQFLLDNPQYVDDTPEGRLLRARCAIKLEKHHDALEILENTHIQDSENQEPTPVYANVAYLKGTLYIRDSNADKAKRCYVQALHADVRCIDAFQALVDNFMLSSDEEQNLISTLPFEAHCGEGADSVQSMYISQLKKYANLEQLDEAITRMDNDGLENNSLTLISKADLMFTQSKFAECLKMTKRILKNDPYNITCRTIHIACLCELGKKRDLFQSAHDLVEHLPEQAVSWFGVGCYYYLVGNYQMARRYFALSSSMDKEYGPAWLGFGHSFAAAGEHDHALIAYTSASRHLIGSHLPDLYMGMQYFQTNHLNLASEYFNLSKSICDSDPLLWNEIGVLEFSKDEFQNAENAFLKAVQIVEDSRAKLSMWAVIWSNLGHVYKKQRRFDLCLQHFEKVLTMEPYSATAYAGIAYVHHARRNFDQAVSMYHRSLGLDPTNTVVAELLNEALESASHMFNTNLPPELQSGALIDDEMYIPEWNPNVKQQGGLNCALSDMEDEASCSDAVAIFEDAERQDCNDGDVDFDDRRSVEPKRHTYLLRPVAGYTSRPFATPQFGNSRKGLESDGDDVDMDVV